MNPTASRQLTDRQRAVMERIDRRVPIKVIANDLGVSETRVNQHIRALKNIYSAESLNELVETYRKAEGIEEGALPPFSESAFTKNQLPGHAQPRENDDRVDHGEIVFHDVIPFDQVSDWEPLIEPKVVPGVLDGDHAVLVRFAVIVGIALGTISVVVLMITATVAIGEALADKTSIPDNYLQPAS